MRAFKWIPTWQDLDEFWKFLSFCALDESSLSIESVKRNMHSTYSLSRDNNTWPTQQSYNKLDFPLDAVPIV